MTKKGELSVSDNEAPTEEIDDVKKAEEPLKKADKNIQHQSDADEDNSIEKSVAGGAQPPTQQE